MGGETLLYLPTEQEGIPDASPPPHCDPPKPLSLSSPTREQPRPLPFVQRMATPVAPPRIHLENSW